MTELLKIFWVLFFLFSGYIIPLKAQEMNIYKEMLKETIKLDLKEIAIPIEINPDFQTEIDKEGFRNFLSKQRIEHFQNNGSKMLPKDKIPKLPTKITITAYTSSNKPPIDTGKFNGDGSFSGEFATKEIRMMSKGVYGMVNVSSLFSKISKKKESKKEKTLRKIKMIYNIED